MNHFFQLETIPVSFSTVPGSGRIGINYGRERVAYFDSDGAKHRWLICEPQQTLFHEDEREKLHEWLIQFDVTLPESATKLENECVEQFVLRYNCFARLQNRATISDYRKNRT